MTEYIEREAAMSASDILIFDEPYGTSISAIRRIPAADVAPVVHGKWEYYSATMMECSNCKRHTARHKFSYCPHCGAAMEDHYNDV